jgi:hypothetical protein
VAIQLRQYPAQYADLLSFSQATFSILPVFNMLLLWWISTGRSNYSASGGKS